MHNDIMYNSDLNYRFPEFFISIKSVFNDTKNFHVIANRNLVTTFYSFTAQFQKEEITAFNYQEHKLK